MTSLSFVPTPPVPAAFPLDSHSASRAEARDIAQDAPDVPSLPHTPPTHLVDLRSVGAGLPSFPVETLPPWVGRYVEAVTEHLEVPFAMTALIALGAISAALAGKVEAEPREGWREPVNLYLAVSANPGERKSAVVQKLFGPIHDWETETLKRLEEERECHARERPYLLAALARTADDAIASADSEGGRLRGLGTRAQIAAELAASDDDASRSVRVFADDATPERLVEMLSLHGGRAAIVSAEGAAFFARLATHSALEILLKAHAGEPLRVDRITRDSIHIPRPAITTCLCLQPGVFHRVKTNRRFREIGLLARFLVAVPQPRVGTRSHDTPPIPATLRSAYEFRLKSLLELTPCDPLAVVRFNEEARARLRAFTQELEPRIAPGTGDLRALADWVSKLAGHVVRIATLLHVAEHAGEIHFSFDEDRVEPATVEKAIRIARFLLDQARRAFDDGHDDRDDQRALFVLRKIHALGKDEFWRRELLRAARTVRAPELTQILTSLVDRGHLAKLPRLPDGERYRVIRSNGV